MSEENWTARKGLPSGGPPRETSNRSQRSIGRAAACAASREAKGAMALARIVRRVSVMVIRISIVLEGKRYRGGLCGWRRNGGGADRPRGAPWLHQIGRFTPPGDG